MEKFLFVARVVAAVPLLGIGVQHLTGAAPMLPILEGAGVPFPEINAVLAPIGEVVAGLLLLFGVFPRVGGMMAVGSMLGALFAHVRFDWADEPPIALPLVVLVLAALVAAKGAGAFAVSLRRKSASAVA